MNVSTLTPDELSDLLNKLQREGFKVGIDHHIAVNDLLIALAGHGAYPCSREALRNWLAPFLCTSPQEQDAFDEHFNQWAERHLKVIPPSTRDDGLAPRTKRPPLQRRLQTLTERTRLWHLIVASIVLVAIAAMCVSLVNPPPKIYQLHGRVHARTDDASSTPVPVRGAEVKFLERTQFTNPNGEFTFTYPETEKLQSEPEPELTVTATGYLSKNVKVDLNRDDAESLKIELDSLGTLVLNGRVLDEKDSPVAGAMVAFLQKETPTGPDGDFEFSYPASHGRGEVTATHSTHGYISQMVALNRSLQPVTLKFKAKSLNLMTGTVEDSDDSTPVLGATVSLGQQIATTSEAGEFILLYEGIESPVTVTVTHPDYQTANPSISVNGPNVIKMVSPPLVIFEEPQRWVEIYQHYFPWIRGAVFIVPLLIFGIWWAWWAAHRRILIRRQMATQIPHIERLVVEGEDQRLFQNKALRATAHKLRRHREVESRDLNVTATVNETTQKGGWFTPIHASRPMLPEYLVLIDRAGFRDHQARFADELIDQLIQENIYVTWYYFHNDPRDCWTGDPYAPHITVQELAAQYPDHRLMIFSDGSGFISPFTGMPSRWLNQFEPWVDRALLTPQPISQWGYQEWVLSALDFVVLPASQVGLDIFIETIQAGTRQLFRTLQSLHANNSDSPYPEMLQVRTRRWLEQQAPSTEEGEKLCQQLRDFLDEDGYDWLCACAVYPQLSWGLTISLANRLQKGNQPPLLTDERLLKLARLPWFRHGSMPDWLRLKLISELSNREATVRGVLNAILQSALKKHQAGVALEIASKSPSTKRLWSRFTRGTPKDNTPHDYVFLNFMSGRKRSKLVMILPDVLRRLLFHNGQVTFGTRPAVVFLMAIGVALLGWRVLVPMPPRPHIEVFKVRPSSVVKGKDTRVVVTWETTGADIVGFEDLSYDVNPGTFRSVEIPATSSTMTLAVGTDQDTLIEMVAKNENGFTRTQPKRIRVINPNKPIIRLFTTAGTSEVDTTIRLIWIAEQANGVSIEPGIGEVPQSGIREVPVATVERYYTLVATNDIGETRATVQPQIQRTGTVVISVQPTVAEITLAKEKEDEPEQIVNSDEEVKLATGIWRARAEANGYKPAESYFGVAEGSTQTIRLTLEPLPDAAEETGELTISVSPQMQILGGTITLRHSDGTIRTVKSGEQVKLRTGRWGIRVEIEGYHPHHQSVQIIAGQAQTVKLTLERWHSGTGTLIISAEPDTAIITLSVLIRQPLPSQTASHGDRLELASTRWRAVAAVPGYQTDEKTVDIIAGETQSVAFTLQKTSSDLGIITPRVEGLRESGSTAENTTQQIRVQKNGYFQNSGYRESFDEGLPSGWEDVFGDWAVSDGQLTVTHPPTAKKTSTLVTYGAPSWRNYQLEASLTWVQGAAAAMWVRLQPKSTGEQKYGIGWVLLNRDEGKTTIYWEIAGVGEEDENGVRKTERDFKSVNWEKEMRLKLRVDGSSYRAYINGTLVHQLEDTTFQSGFAGLDINLGWKLPVSWDDVSIQFPIGQIRKFDGDVRVNSVLIREDGYSLYFGDRISTGQGSHVVLDVDGQPNRTVRLVLQPDTEIVLKDIVEGVKGEFNVTDPGAGSIKLQ